MKKKLQERFTKKNGRKLIRPNLKQKKLLREKVLNCMSNEKTMIIHLIAVQIKKYLYIK